MKKNLALALLLALFSSPAVAGDAEPKLVVDKKSYNFGRIFQGETLSYTFRFRNLGDGPLQIEKVRTSCGCTAALLSDTRIAPGEAGEIKTTFDSGRFRGQVSKTVYLYSNDPVQPVSQFHLRGTVQPEIEQNPDRVDLGPLTPEVEQVARVELVNRGNGAITFGAVETTARELRAEMDKATLAPGESGEVIIRAELPAGVARVNGYVLVDTSSTLTPQLRIPVYGAVAP